jgi:hypothetical protein
LGRRNTSSRGIRDLRDLGFKVEWHKVSDKDQYMLKSLEPDLDKAALILVRRNLKDDKKLGKNEKEKLLRSLLSEIAMPMGV